MFRQVKWSARSVYEWSDMLDYWTNRNKSNAYSLKLDRLLKESLDKIARASETGKPTDFPSVRTKIVRDYLVYYRIHPEYIDILGIWDSRRDPKKFRL